MEWSDSATTAFEALKQAMSTTPVLALPDFSKEFVVETDASGYRIGVVLMQDSHPLVHMSKALSDAHLSLPIYEKEMLVIVKAIEKWRPYLIGRHFIIKTNHQPLKYLMEQRISTPSQQKWVAKLMGYDYTIVYKCGKENLAADALSRCPTSPTLHLLTTTITSDFLDRVKTSYTYDGHLSQLVHQLQHNPLSHPLYMLTNGVLYRREKIVVGDSPSLKQDILHSLHDSAVRGHSDISATLFRVNELYYWKKMKRDIYTHVKRCEICQKCKGENVRYPGLLQPLPVPNKVWQDISLDFIAGLPKVHNKSVIFVVVDRLSKYAHFMCLNHPYTASVVAQVFLDNVYKLHGLPRTIVSDRDVVFLSKFWQALFDVQGVQLHHSSAYHPQSDGQTEAINKCVEGYLRCMCSDRPKEWVQWLPLAEWWYNTTYHSAIKLTPFEVLYGQKPPTHFPYIPHSSLVDTVDRSLQARESTIRLLKHHLLRAQDGMKAQADKNRCDRVFAVGDSVFVKLQPYRQLSLKSHVYHKLNPKYFGPFVVLKRIGSVAYRLQLPSPAKIHDVFHVSQLKKCTGNTLAIPTLPVTLSPHGYVVLEPEAILDTRSIKKGNSEILQHLVKWFNCPSEDSSWVDAASLRQQFPQLSP